MECPSLKQTETSEPILSAAAFEQRCRTLAEGFSTALDQPKGDILFSPEIIEKRALMSLGGRASEVITRNRGGHHRVLPLCLLSQDIYAWIGFRERWSSQGNEQNYRFDEGGFTLHVGRVGEVAKPQVMRSEWIGRRNAGFGNLAGHPHWQVDVLETVRRVSADAPATFGSTEAPEAMEFSPLTNDSGAALLMRFTAERMHLASAAAWWRQPAWPVATAPTSVPELNRWVLGCISYLRQEVQRCVILSPA
jgi:hypothetical protein